MLPRLLPDMPQSSEHEASIIAAPAAVIPNRIVFFILIMC